MSGDRAPWRLVVETSRQLGLGKLAARWQRLDCGHTIWFRGERAIDAPGVKRRRCHQCKGEQA